MAEATPRSKPSGEISNDRFENKIREQKENKARQVKSTKGRDKLDKSVSLDDINDAIRYYFEEVILPKVYDGTNLEEVPVLYGNKERWASIQKDGFIRDKKGQILLPTIVYKRTGLNKSTSLPVDKLDGNLNYYYARKYSPKNRYDRFSVQQGLNKTREIHQVSVPDYYDLNYEVVVNTDYVSHMNKIIESIQYNEGRYWGREDDFKFKVSIDSYDENIELDQSSDRVIKTQFQMSVFGYLTPETVNNQVNNKQNFSVQKVVIGTETVKTAEEL